jgi:hypothetical protein
LLLLQVLAVNYLDSTHPLWQYAQFVVALTSLHGMSVVEAMTDPRAKCRSALNLNLKQASSYAYGAGAQRVDVYEGAWHHRCR